VGAVSNNDFLTYDDLPSYGVKYTRVHLTRLMRKGLFPIAVRLSPNRIAWHQADIEKWVAERPPAQVVQVQTLGPREASLVEAIAKHATATPTAA
jgi:hypothetical protein